MQTHPSGAGHHPGAHIRKNRPLSLQLHERAQQRIPGGVNSPVRAFRGVGGEPVYMASAKGAHMQDVDGHLYIDYINSWGAMILGHAHPRVVAAIRRQAELSPGYGTPTMVEVELAETICTRIPGMEQVRMVNSGTEATMSSIRLARGFTGRELVVKFAGCYHGHVDSLLVKAGSGALTLGQPDSAGVPAGIAKDTLVLPFNDSQRVRDLFRIYGDRLAAVIVEPIAGNMNCIPPEPEFLPCLREACEQSGCVLIFDEVMTGFRVHPAGAQGLYGIRPDLTTLGKIIGGGLPVGAFGGRADIMARLAPDGPVYQAGTLSGNPTAVAAGLATVQATAEEGFYDRLMTATETLCAGICTRAAKHGIPIASNHACGMFGLFFSTEEKISSYQQVMACNFPAFRRFFHLILDAGVYLAPSAFEAGFVSSAHDQAVIEHTLMAFDSCFERLAAESNESHR